MTGDAPLAAIQNCQVKIVPQFDVTFLTRDGGKHAVIRVKYDSTVEDVPAAPEVFYHSFAGWKDGETVYTAEQIAARKVTAAVTYQAAYTANSYTISHPGVDGADEVCKTYPKAYELAIKAQLFLMFHILFSQCCTAEAPLKNRKSLEKMKLIIKYVENNYMEKISIADMAKEAGLSQSHFMKFFKNTMGTSFIDYLNDYRLTMVSRLLVSSESSILDIAAESGFDNLSYFNRMFKKRFGMTPREYRKKFMEN